MDRLACRQGLQEVQLAMEDLPMSSAESFVLYLSVGGTKIKDQRKYSHISLDMRDGKGHHGRLSSPIKLLLYLESHSTRHINPQQYSES